MFSSFGSWHNTSVWWQTDRQTERPWCVLVIKRSDLWRPQGPQKSCWRTARSQNTIRRTNEVHSNGVKKEPNFSNLIVAVFCSFRHSKYRRRYRCLFLQISLYQFGFSVYRLPTHDYSKFSQVYGYAVHVCFAFRSSAQHYQTAANVFSATCSSLAPAQTNN